ncbi:MAG: NAD(P)H-binding protein [Rhodospirillaceae bacterium]|nr:NAD(P)H-binding protein [Rhodospirillaceae bacterium]
MLRFLSVLALALAALTWTTGAHAQTKPADGSVLVFGATGQLGSDIVHALVKAGHSVTVFVRPSADMKRIAGLNVASVQGDVLNADDVARAFKAAKYKAAVDALARGTAGPEFYDTSERNISKWAKETGVSQVILHSSVGAGKSKAIYPPQMWERMKPTLLAKEAGENHLIASGVPYTVIRNGYLPPSSTPATGKAKLYEDETKPGNVTRADLATLTLQCIGNTACFNKIYHADDETIQRPQPR